MTDDLAVVADVVPVPDSLEKRSEREWRIVAKRKTKKPVSLTGQPREAELRAQIQRLSDELSAIVEAHETAQAAPYIGQCFKYRNRSSQGDEWSVYYRVTKHDGGNHFTAFKFEAQKDGWHIVCDREGFYLLPDPKERGLIAITAREFERAWLRYLDGLLRMFEASER